jgi:hypothetical protein
MIKRLLFLGVFISGVSFCMAQNDNPQLKNVIPPSPTVASLGKYGEIPVGLYTGTPNISIPLYEIKEGPLSVPISISYHAAGIRVEEIASNVGLGWTLNAGGMLSKQIRGSDDDTGWIKPSPYRIRDILQSGNSSAINSFKQQLQYSSFDGEPDLYYYNFNTQSGKFLFDEDGTLYNYPAKNVSITRLGGSHSYGAGWKVISEDGTLYEFNATEHVYTGRLCDGVSSESYMAWYLTKITSADGKRHIDFVYEPIMYNVAMPIGLTRYFPMFPGDDNCIPQYSDCTSNSLYTTNRLAQINFSNGYVKFDYNTPRLDMPGTDRLDAIKVYSTSSSGNKQVKEYRFGYGYFGPTNATTYDRRLKLTSLTEYLPTGSKPPHVFTYEETIPMPNRFSPNKDHWGYFNGANNNNGIPNFTYKFDNGNSWPINGGANRNANANTMQACILKKIKYPTGGETLFTYETNQSTDTRIAVAEFTQTPYVLADNQPWPSLTSPYETGTFIVPAGNEVEVSFSMTGLETSGHVNYCQGHFSWVLLKDGNPTSIMGNSDGLDGQTLDLDPGTYKFRLIFADCWQGNLNYYIVATVKVPVEHNGTILRHVGGLRIKQMEDKPADGGPSVIKKYKYPVGGTLVNFPSYGYEYSVEVWESPNFIDCHLAKRCNYIAVTSSTNYPLATTNGSYVGYNVVIEDLGANGEIEHTYKAYSDPPGVFPFPPMEMSDWERGSELMTNYYSLDENGGRIPRKSILYSYGNFEAGNVKGYKASSNIKTMGCILPSANPPFITYDVLPDFYYLSGITERTYDQNNPNKWIETSTVYKYSNAHYQQNEVMSSVSGSGGTIKDQVVVKRKFPQDYNTSNASGSEALGIKKLNDLHIVNVPIEEYTIRQKLNTTNNQITDAHIVSGAITTFKSTDPYPDKVLMLEKNGATSLANYGSGSTIGTGNLFVKNANATVSNAYKPAVEFNSFDEKGNLIMQRQTDGTYTSYIWGYNGQYPIAKIENATYSEVSAQVANLQSKSNADNDRTRGSIGNEGLLRDALESLRVSLPNAMVTTYTYDPLIGVTSMTDPKGYTVYYEYDDLNRLEKVRDASGKLLSTNEYRYKDQ